MLTAIADRAGRSFPRHAHTNGFASWKSGAVTIENETPTSVNAKVRGQRTRDVTFQEEKGRLVVSCSCPSRTFELPGCKHAWATLLEIDRRGALPNLRATRAPLPVRFLEPIAPSSADSAEAHADSAPEAKAKAPDEEKKKTGRKAKAKTKGDAEADGKAEAEAEAEAKAEAEARAEAVTEKKAKKKNVAAITKAPVKGSSSGSDRASRRSVRATSAPPGARGKLQRGQRRASGRRR